MHVDSSCTNTTCTTVHTGGDTTARIIFKHGPRDWKPALLVPLLVYGSCTGGGKMRGLKRATLQQMLDRKRRHGWDSARMHDMQFTSICAHQWRMRRYNSHAE
jgi:hypothetical protein